MDNDGYRTAEEIPEEELEEMIRDAFDVFRDDIREIALAWLDQRLRVYKIATAMGIRSPAEPPRV